MKNWLRWLGLLAFARYALFLARNTAVVTGGSDSSGYLNSARVLTEGKWLATIHNVGLWQLAAPKP